MFNGERLRDLMASRGVSQSALARNVGVSQTTIAKLVTGRGYGSKYLHRIARALGTTPEYLSNETDDPKSSIPDLNPSPPLNVMIPVTMPNENALAEMFAGMLLAIDRSQSLDEVARELAQLLPTGLLTLQGRLIELPRPPRAPGPPAFPQSSDQGAPAAPSNADHEFGR